ncbi:hypothetical protein [Domibacillus robiginosus]|uniref:hypothetical protein n=1 Tax=Domibacillus robiginosus TaxID=1071054 RepID=UPI00067C0100|nr:hypothetical protein [Domibacillus robiginosus]
MDILKVAKYMFSRIDRSIQVESNMDMYDQGKYLGRGKIEINEKRIIEGSKRKNIDLEVYSFIVIMHEYGHHLDPDLMKMDRKIFEYQKRINQEGDRAELWWELKRYSMKAEENAWKYAAERIPLTIRPIFEKERANSLKEHELILDIKVKAN